MSISYTACEAPDSARASSRGHAERQAAQCGQAADSPREPPPACDLDWAQNTDADGYTYYYNVVTGETRWQLPGASREMLPPGGQEEQPQEQGAPSYSLVYGAPDVADGVGPMPPGQPPAAADDRVEKSALDTPLFSIARGDSVIAV